MLAATVFSFRNCGSGSGAHASRLRTTLVCWERFAVEKTSTDHIYPSGRSFELAEACGTWKRDCAGWADTYLRPGEIRDFENDSLVPPRPAVGKAFRFVVSAFFPIRNTTRRVREDSTTTQWCSTPQRDRLGPLVTLVTRHRRAATSDSPPWRDGRIFARVPHIWSVRRHEKSARLLTLVAKLPPIVQTIRIPTEELLGSDHGVQSDRAFRCRLTVRQRAAKGGRTSIVLPCRLTRTTLFQGPGGSCRRKRESWVATLFKVNI